MDNSNCREKCTFVKSGFCESDKDCPFYVETLWQKHGDPTPKIVKDCSPKKMMIEQNALLHRFLCSQSVLEDVRNRMDKLQIMLELLISNSTNFIKEKTNELQNSTYEKLNELEFKE